MRFSGKCLLFSLAISLLTCFLPLQTKWTGAVTEAAQFAVTLEIENTHHPIGGSTYRISGVIFTRGGVDLDIIPLNPPEEIRPQESRILGPFSLPARPDELTLKGTRTAAHIFIPEDVSSTVAPITWDAPQPAAGGALILTARIAELEVPTLTQWGTGLLCALAQDGK